MKFIKNTNINSFENVEYLSNKLDFSRDLIEILVSRGYDSEEKIDKFLNPSINDLYDPFLLSGMREIIDTINRAIENKSRILIFGDYDVDGISATSILYKYLKTRTEDVHYYLPNRYEDGYGLSIDNCKKIVDRFKPELIITVDCGISCKKEVDYLLSLGIEVVVTDHHDIPEEIPNCVCVNAKLPNQEYPFKALCGAGVALKIVQAFLGKDKLTEYLPICAIATVADIVSLVDENRAIVTLGLSLCKNLPLGVQILLKNLNLNVNNLSSSDIAYKVAPKLNAAGRLGDAKVALKLFISDSKKEIYQNIEKLTEMNTTRQELCNKIYGECIEKISRNSINRSKFIILQDKNWDSGLLGIVCARLVEEYNRPAFLFSNVNGILHGSVRSISNINIHDVLSSCSSTLETFGGHTVAAGLTLKEEKYVEFIKEIDKYFNENYSDLDIDCVKYYDMDLDISKVNFNFVKELSILEPFGCDNPRPTFKIQWQNNSVLPMKNYPSHLSVKVNQSLSLVGFNFSRYLEDFMFFTDKTALIEFQLNEYKGKVTAKGLLKYVVFNNYSQYYMDCFIGDYFREFTLIKGHKKHNIIKYEKSNMLNELSTLLNKSKFGTLIVVNSLKSFDKIKNELENFDITYCVNRINTSRGENACIMNLIDFSNVKNYENVFFIDGVLSYKYLNNISNNIYVQSNAQFDSQVLQLETQRPTFIAFYKAFENMASREVKAKDEYSFYISLKRTFQNLKQFDYKQYIACLYVFNELGIVDIIKEDNYQLKINSGVKTILDNSSIYANLKLINKLAN